MKKASPQKVWMLILGLFAVMLLQLFSVADGAANTTPRINANPVKGNVFPLKLRQDPKHVVMDNGLLQISLSIPGGDVTGIQYNGKKNILETHNDEGNRGYWDNNWNGPGEHDGYDRISGTNYRIIVEDENQLEVSFTRNWTPALKDTSNVPLNIDKRYVMRRGVSGFYSYAIYSRPPGWPDIVVDETRIVFKLQGDMFQYMAVSDDRQRVMPMPEDRSESRSEPLAYHEAVLLTNPSNPSLKGEVDDKYMYSCDNKDNKVHGWVSTDSSVGFWLISPSNEFRNAGPVKQDLTSHVGPTTTGYFVSTHYAGPSVAIHLQNGEPWSKVFGPVFIYLNSASPTEHPRVLWENAKAQMLVETNNWPYDFLHSKDYSPPHQRGIVSGSLLVRDRYISKKYMRGKFAYVGLALPGEVGSWQKESKGYQFWTQADEHGKFTIKGVRPGAYNLYAWVPGIIGDYKSYANITIRPGSKLDLGFLVYRPPRHGPTLWEIGFPDRTAAEFFIPDPNPTMMNRIYTKTEKFRQYGLWQRYAELYPDHDLVYHVGRDDYKLDWFFAHVTRNVGNDTYRPTTWQIVFEIKQLIKGSYKLQLALASAHYSRLEVRFNNQDQHPAHFTTGAIGRDNAIARHGIHGLYRLFSIDIPSSLLLEGKNTIFLTQSKHETPFNGVMYDYIRLEGPPSQL